MPRRLSIGETLVCRLISAKRSRSSLEETDSVDEITHNTNSRSDCEGRVMRSHHHISSTIDAGRLGRMPEHFLATLFIGYRAPLSCQSPSLRRRIVEESVCQIMRWCITESSPPLNDKALLPFLVGSNLSRRASLAPRGLFLALPMSVAQSFPF
jgi:hypothetical protein